MVPAAQDAWWREPLERCLASVAADGKGLTAAEASRRLAKYGPNVIRERRIQSAAVQLLERFRNPLVIILLVAAAFSAFTGEVANFIIIAVIIALSTTLDFVQEFRAGRAADRLRQSVALHASVVRDGQDREVPMAEVVPGDVMLLAAGDLVPADGRVLEARDLFVNQALLTGEPFPVEKSPPAPPPGDSGLDLATNAVFAGSSVVSGNARALAIKTGAAGTIGGIAGSLAKPAPPGAYELGIRRFGLMILRLTILLSLFTLLVNTWLQRPWLDSFLFALALAVGLTPELLPMVVTVTLSRGAMRMARQRVIVKRLAAIHNLGSMDILCTDKTGTLTEARIRLDRCVDAQGRPNPRVLHLASLNSRFQSGLKSPLDEAILRAADPDPKPWRKIDEVPFDFERRRVSLLLDNGEIHLLVVKGAPEELLRRCTHCEIQDAPPSPLGQELRGVIQAQYEALESDGLRALAIASRALPKDRSRAAIGDETDLVFAGFAVFLDPPKASAASALSALQRSGVAIKVVTGDSDRVARHVCASIGLPVSEAVLGSDLEHLDELALAARVESANLFCRITPMQKQRIILALKSRGHVVGYLGDGINDAPSLHSADVGLSVDSAVDVAKEAADIILLERDLHVLHDGVLEGRRTFANIMKYIMMGTSSNFGNMFSMAGAALFLPFLPMLPTQILLNNILYDISEIPIPLDRVEAADMERPRVLDVRFIFWFMLAIGPISSVFDFLTFYVLRAVMHADAALFQTGWFVESLCTQVLVIFVIRTSGNPFKGVAHPALAATSLAVVAAAVVIPFTRLGTAFGFVPLPATYYGLLAIAVLLYLAAVQVAKRAFLRRVAAKPAF